MKSKSAGSEYRRSKAVDQVAQAGLTRHAEELNAQEGMVTPGRLELPTRSLGNCCSIHLSYGAICNFNQLQYFLK